MKIGEPRPLVALQAPTTVTPTKAPEPVPAPPVLPSDESLRYWQEQLAGYDPGAMRLAVEAGRQAWLAGRMPRKLYAATPSSPTTGLIR